MTDLKSKRSPHFFRVCDFFDADGEVVISEIGYANLNDLCDIVLNVHYSYVLPVDREDLVSVGVIKALELLKAGCFDVERSSLKNYLYTGIRNEMKNYIYKNRGKDTVVDDEILTGINEDKINSIDYTDDTITISDEMLKPYLDRFSKRVDNLEFKLKSSLFDMGFIVTGEFERKSYEEVSKIICLIIWKKLR